MRLLHGAGELDGGAAIRVGELAPHEIDAGIGVSASTPDRLFHAASHRAVGVRTGDDHEFAVEPVALGEGSAVLAESLLAGDHGLPRDMAAALGEAPVFTNSCTVRMVESALP